MTGPSPHSSLANKGFLREALLTSNAALLVVLFGVVLLLLDPGFFWHDDYQTQHLPARCDIARAWRAGEVPLLSPYSWHCGALAAEYQYAVFSVFEAVCVTAVFSLDLSLPTTAAVLVLIQLAVLAAGAFRLARFHGLSPDLAMLPALVAALNGWVIVWGAMTWFPGLATFAWLPWFWWGLERAVRPDGGPARFVPAGIFLYLIATGGWPFTVLMAAAVSVAVAGRTCLRESVRRTWPVAAAWAIGVALSAPAWMMLVEYYQQSIRATLPTQPDLGAIVPLTALPALILPAWVANFNGFSGSKPHQWAELAGGLVPVVGLVAGLYRLGRDFRRRWAFEFMLLVSVLALAMLPSLGTFRWSYRWLPLFFLTLALLAAHAVAELRSRVNIGLWGFGLVVPVSLAACLSGMEPFDHVLKQALALTGLALVWAVVDHFLSVEAFGRRWMPCAVALVSLGLAYADVRRFLEVPTWPMGQAIRDPAPLDPARRYFCVYDVRDVVERDETPGVTNWVQGRNVDLRHANTWMYAGVPAINGYTPIMPLGLYDVFRFVSPGVEKPEHGERLLRQWAGPDGLLQFVGVDGLVVADRFAPQTEGLKDQGWQRMPDVNGGTVWHRKAPLAPRVRSASRVTLADDWDTALAQLRREHGPHTPVVVGAASTQQFAFARIGEVAEGRNRMEVEVVNESAQLPALVVFLRPWYPGYRAQLDGQPLPVTVVDLTLPAVMVPAGERGRLVLEYRPTSLVVGGGLAVAVLGLLGCLLTFRLTTVATEQA